MKKICYSLFTAIAAVGMLASCSSDRDSNPTMDQTVTSFVLNQPAAADTQIDLQTSDFVNLTTTQPDWGFPAATTYTTYVALSEEALALQEDESGETTIGGDMAVAIGTTSTTTDIALPAEEINNAILTLIGDGSLDEPI